MRTARLTIKFVEADEFNVVPGSGWVVLNHGKRIDWPMMATQEEALKELADFRRQYRQLAADEASERRCIRFASNN
jgi:hypothetical protein